MINDIIFEPEDASSSTFSEATSPPPDAADSTTTTNNGRVRSWLNRRTQEPKPSINVLERLQQTLRSIEASPSAHLFKDHVQGLKLKLQRANYYLKQQQQSLLASENLARQKQRLSSLLRVLQEEAIDLVLRLNVDLPRDESDVNHIIWEHSNAQERREHEERFLMFPPLLHQMVGPVVELIELDDHNGDGKNSIGGSTAESWDSDDSVWIENTFLDPDYVPWDFKQIVPAKRPWFGIGAASSASQSSTCRYDRRLYYSKIQALRALPQSTPAPRFRVVLAQLDPGDTTPSVLVGQSVVTALLGPIYAFNAGATIGTRAMVTGKTTFPLADSAWADAKMAASSAFQFTKNTFLHFLLEFDLRHEDGETTCTLERCADDVYLYQGTSSRPKKKAVFFGTAPDLKLRDLIAFRNEQRATPYNLRGNNCKDLVWKFLAGTFDLPLDPKNFSFNGSCQVIYGADWPSTNFNETFSLLKEQHQEFSESEDQPLLQRLSEAESQDEEEVQPTQPEEEEEEEEEDEEGTACLEEDEEQDEHSAEENTASSKGATEYDEIDDAKKEDLSDDDQGEPSAGMVPKGHTTSSLGSIDCNEDEIENADLPNDVQEKRVSDWIQSLREKSE